MIEAYERGEAPAFELYALGLEHKHVPEIIAYSKLSERPLFMPSVGNFRQGMLVSIPLALDAIARQAQSRGFRRRLCGSLRGGETCPAGGRADKRQARPAGAERADDMELFVVANEARRHALLIARLDNLGKGAAGAAVQNLDLMMGKTAVSA